jgi:LysM repeat protein
VQKRAPSHLAGPVVPLLSVLVLVVVLVLAACSGGDGDSASDTSVPTTRPILTTTLATSTTAPTVGQAYTIQAGDTLGRIASDFGITLDRLLEFNGLDGTEILQPGHRILIPPAPGEEGAGAGGEGEGTEGGEDGDPDLPAGSSSYVVVAGDTLNLIASSHGITLDELLEANGIQADSLIMPGDELVIPPPAATTTSIAEE